MGGHGKGNVAAICAKHLSVGDCAVDIGTADGEEALAMAKAVGTLGFVLVMEPDPRRRSQLEAFAKEYPQVQYYRGAASDVSTQEALMHLPWDGKQSSLCKATIKEDCRNELAYAVRLDDWDFKGKPPKLVKMDAQGWEVRILRGARRLLTECPILIMECWPWGLKQAGTSMQELFALIAESGHQMCWSDGCPVTLKECEEWATQCRHSTHTNLIAKRA